jgi:RNA polymerase sigma-70 factor (ECF subfamily)
MPESDENRWSALMAAAQSGDETAYRQLLEELAEVVRNFLLSRFGHSEFVDDCVQETLISVHQARHTWDPARPFRAWLFAIVRNKSIDMFRQRRTRARVLEHYQRDQEVLAQAGSEGRVQSEISGGRLLESLPEPQREALVLTKIIGYSGAEAAQRLGISEGAVKLRVHRAVRSLRRMLAKERSG